MGKLPWDGLERKMLLDNLADVVEASNSTACAVDGDEVAPAKPNRAGVG